MLIKRVLDPILNVLDHFSAKRLLDKNTTVLGDSVLLVTAEKIGYIEEDMLVRQAEHQGASVVVIKTATGRVTGRHKVEYMIRSQRQDLMDGLSTMAFRKNTPEGVKTFLASHTSGEQPWISCDEWTWSNVMAPILKGEVVLHKEGHTIEI